MFTEQDDTRPQRPERVGRFQRLLTELQEKGTRPLRPLSGRLTPEDMQLAERWGRFGERLGDRWRER
jgi:hypothetical protein